MNNKYAILAIDREIERTQQEQDEAVKNAARPFIQKIADLRVSRELLQKELGDNEQPIKLYTGKKRGRKPKLQISLSYPLQGTVLQKLSYVLNEIARFATIREIASMVMMFEPKMQEAIIKERFSKHITKFRFKGYIVSYKIGSQRNTVYGFPKWLDENKKPLEGREPDTTVLIDKFYQEPGNSFDSTALEAIEKMKLAVPNNVNEFIDVSQTASSMFPAIDEDIQNMFKK